MNKPLNPWKLTGYKAGQNVACKVMAQEPGGYAVVIPKDNLPGFLPTEEKLKIGEEVLAQFVCVHNNRILLSSRFSTTVQPTKQTTAEQAVPKIDWAQQLQSGTYNSYDVQQGAQEQDAAFNVWAAAHPRKFSLKRATDLMLPPLSSEGVNSFKIADYDLEWLITDLEGGMRTGCVKASSEERLSRSAMLLYRGRAVGCIYGCKSMTDTLPMEQSLGYMLADLALPSTQVTIYDLPEDVTLPLSALFLGYPVEGTEGPDAHSYMGELLNWFAQKEQTACLAITLSSNSATCLGFVHKGQFTGSFYVEDQTLSRDRGYFSQLMANDPKVVLAASILPSEMISSAVRFGFSLSMARPRS